MCGRTACTLQPNQLCSLCKFRDKQGNVRTAFWRNSPAFDPKSPSTSDYVPSFNFAPENFGPVLVSGNQFREQFSTSDRVIQPMKWGLVPSWHKGDPKDFGYRMINARAEGLTEKASFRNPLKQGRRCVVLADGFYEWLHKGSAKLPYFIHFPQDKSVDFFRPESEEDEHNNDQRKKRRLLTMAGVFDICHTKNGEPLYSYTVITVPSGENLSWIHDRMPAILDGEEVVEKWLDAENVPVRQALNLLCSVENLEFYRVGNYVNNVQNKGPNCVSPLKEVKKEEKQEKNQASLLAFFRPKPMGKQKLEPVVKEEETDAKKLKFEGK